MLRPRVPSKSPPRVRAFIFNVTSVPFESIAVPLSSFKWDYDKGDIYHWVDLLNHFDSFFEKFLKSRKDLLLEETALDSDDIFPKESVLQILRVTRIILENCVNKHCYSSYEYLSLLLSSTDADIVTASLYTLVAFVKKPVQTNRAIKWHGDAALNARLFSLSQGWGGKEEGLGLLSCAIENGCDEVALKSGSTLHFEFYSGETQGENVEVNFKPCGLKVIHLSDLHLRCDTDLQLLKQLIEEYNIPASFRFFLLTRLRFARAFPVLPLRRQYLCIRLLAFTALLQSNAVLEDLTAFFTNEPEFIDELVELLHCGDTVPENIQVLSTFALTALSHDRSRQSSVLNAISGGGHRGILPILMQKAAGSVTSVSSNCSVFLLDALLSLIAVLVSSSSGCAALREAGLIPTLLPLLKDLNPEHIYLVSSAVHILEAFMDYNNPAGALFRDLGGLDDAITRLKLEVSRVEEASKKFHEETEYLVKGKLPYVEDTDAQQNTNMHPETLISFQQRILLKALLRAIALGTYAPGNGARLHGFEGSSLLSCLCTIFKHAKVFGGGVFSLAASVMSDLIHKDPTCFTVLDAAGLPASFLAAITSGVLPSSEAVSCIPHSLDALCLNNIGLQAVRESNALSCFVKIFTSKLYLRALANGTPGSIASGLDELMRHAPSLRGSTVDTCILILKRIAVIGGCSDETLVVTSENNLCTPVPMETDADVKKVDLLASEGHFKAESIQGTEPETNTDVSLPEYINNTARLLETILQNAETGRIFIDKAGIEALLRLYTIPTLPLCFGGYSVAHTLSLAFRAFSPQHASALSHAVCGVLRDHLKTTLEAMSFLQNSKFSDLKIDKQNKAIRCLSATECFLALAAVLVRSTNTMMTELNASEAEVLSNVGKLHREVLWQISLLDDAKVDGKEGDSGNGVAVTAQTIGSSGGEGDDETAVFSIPPHYVNPISIHNRSLQWRIDSSHFPILHAGDGQHRRRREHGGTAEVLSQMARFGRLARRPEATQDMENTLNLTQAHEIPKQKPLTYLNFEVMTRFVCAAKGLYVALGKAMVVPSRRRDDVALPSAAAKAVAAALARLLFDNLSFDGCCGFSDLETITTVKCRYLGKVVDDISAVVFDSRRRTCNTLMVNNLYAYAGFNQLFITFVATCQLLWRILEPLFLSAERENIENEKAEDGFEKNIWLSETLRSYTKLMDVLVTSSLLMTPTSTAQLLVHQHPDRPIPVPRDVETFVRTLQAHVLEAILPVWNHMLLPRCSPIFISSLASILTHIYSGIGDMAGQRNGMAGARFLGPPPDESSIATIVEMGFSRARAEDALRRVETNSVEMAMEWLFAHPEEPREDDDLARALALSLGSSDTSSESVTAKEDEASAIEEKFKTVPVENILATCLTLLKRSDALAFPLTDLLVTLCNRNKGLDRPRVICYLVSHLKNVGIDQRDGDTDLLTTISHTLALILNEDSTTREIAAVNGIVRIALDILSGIFLSKHESESLVLVPKWATALLLVLDHMLQYKPKINQESSDGVVSGATPNDCATEGSDPLVGDKRLEMEVDNKEHNENPFTIVLGKSTGYMSENEDWEVMKVACSLFQTQLTSTTAQALLQLCARLTKTHRIAMQFLELGGLTAILKLPRQCLFPGFDNVAAAIIRHLLEDPQTLQQAMEPEIRHTLVVALQRHNGRVTPRMFLTAMAPVISRDPTIFMQAAAVVCQIENVGGRSNVTLLKEKEREKEKDDKDKDREKCKPSTAVGHENGSCVPSGGDGNAKGHDASTRSSKSHHKRAPFSFSQVIDQLLEVILHFPLPAMETKDVCTVSATTMDVDELVVNEKGKTKVEQCSLNHINVAETSADLAKVAFILKVLTEILLMYSSAVGVVLRRDSESSQGRGPFQGTSEIIGHGGLLYHILHRLLPYSVNETTEKAGENWREKLSEKAAYFLLAICVRSGEGRRRIIAEISGALFHSTNTFEKSKEGYTQLSTRKVHSFIELINLILSAYFSTNSQFPGLSTDIAKTMIDTGLVQSLTGVLQMIDLDHPETPKLVNTLLKALESLTRVANTADQIYGVGGNSQNKGTQEELTSDDRVPVTARQLLDGNRVENTIQSRDQQIGGDVFVEAGLVEGNMSEAPGGGRTSQLEHDLQLGIDRTDRSHLHVDADDLMHENSDHITIEENTSELTFRVGHREIEEDEEMDGDDNDDDDGDEEEEDDEDDEDEMEGAGLTHLSPPYEDIEDHEDTGLGTDFGVDMVEEEDEDDWHEDQVIEVRWGDALTELNHVQVLRNSGLVNLADLARDPFHSINMDDVFSSFRHPTVINRQRPATYRAVLQQGLSDHGGAFRHPLLARPSLSAVVSSMSGITAAGTIRDAEALLGGGFDVSHFMYDGPNIAEHTVEALFGERGVSSQPQTLLDFSMDPMYLMGRRGGRTDGRLSNWTDDGQPQAGAYAAAIAQAIEEHFVSYLQSLVPRGELSPDQAVIIPVGSESQQLLTAVGMERADSGTVRMLEGEDQNVGIQRSQSGETLLHPDSPRATLAANPEGETTDADVLMEEERIGTEARDMTGDESLHISYALTIPDGNVNAENLTASERLLGTSEASQIQVDARSRDEQDDAHEDTPDPTIAGNDENVAVSLISENEVQLHSSALGGAENPLQENVHSDEANINTNTIDPTFLDALPDDLRAEVLASQQTQTSRSATMPPASVEAPADDIDPEFLAALPPDIQAEVLAQQRAQRLIQSHQADGQPVDMDSASIIATFPAELREEVLLTSSDQVLAALPPNLLAEAQLLRERAMNQFHNRNFFGGSHRIGARRNNLGIRTIGSGSMDRGVGVGSVARRPGSTTSNIRIKEFEGKPLVDVSALKAMLQLLRLAQPLAKGILQRLLLNLCSHSVTRATLVILLLNMLRPEVECSPSNSSSDSQSSSYRLFGCQWNVVYARSQLTDGVPPLVSRRALELLIYLCRHHPLVTRLLLYLEPADVSDLSQTLKETRKEKGKGKLVDDVLFCETSEDQKVPLTLLLKLLNQPLYSRSSAHLEQVLGVLEVVTANFDTKLAFHVQSETTHNTLKIMLDGTTNTSNNAHGVPPVALNQGVPGDEQNQSSDAVDHGGTDIAQVSAPIVGQDVEDSGNRSTVQKVDLAAILLSLPEPELRHLCRFLGFEGLSDIAYNRVAEIVKKFAYVAPAHRRLFISELAEAAQKLSSPAVDELTSLCDIERLASSKSSMAGAAILRVLQCLGVLISLEGSLAEKGHENSIEQEQESSEIIKDLNKVLEPLWQGLSMCISKIENRLGSTSLFVSGTSVTTVGNGVASPLPPEAQRVLPFIEAFFVLCEKLRLGCSSSVHIEPSTATAREIKEAAYTSNSALLPASKHSIQTYKRLDGDTTFVRFAEKHRKMLNAFVRQNPSLLDRSLSLLLKAPRLIDFDNKRAHFRTHIRQQNEHQHSQPLRISVRRAYVLEDSYNQLRMRTPEEMKDRMTVQFQGEEGIDAGGLTREWYQVLSRVIFDKGALLFTTVGNESSFQPNMNSVYQTEHLSYFKFVGRVVGKALFDGQLLDVYFTRSFYKHILGVKVTYHDIEAVDPDYYKNLKWVLENDVTTVDLFFSVDANEETRILYEKNEVSDIELVPGGRNIRVTEENKHEYVDLVAEHKLTTAIRPQINAFLEGFNELIPTDLISIFHDKELELLISGLPEIDLDDLKANTEYTGYTVASPVVQWYWEVVWTFSKEDLARLLQFVTGTSKVPLEGFRALQGISGPQKFQIHKAYGAPERLPSAHTCFNQLDLPEYYSKEQLQERLLLAIHEASEGFGFG